MPYAEPSDIIKSISAEYSTPYDARTSQAGLIAVKAKKKSIKLKSFRKKSAKKTKSSPMKKSNSRRKKTEVEADSGYSEIGVGFKKDVLRLQKTTSNNSNPYATTTSFATANRSANSTPNGHVTLNPYATPHVCDAGNQFASAYPYATPIAIVSPSDITANLYSTENQSDVTNPYATASSCTDNPCADASTNAITSPYAEIPADLQRNACDNENKCTAAIQPDSTNPYAEIPIVRPGSSSDIESMCVAPNLQDIENLHVNITVDPVYS